MIFNILYILLAALALGFLIFIHELGHYFIARKEGMIVEVFAIGFGKPIISWNRNGVRWQLCWLPFGGYVKIAGMERKGNLEPYQIENGFFSKSPSARIRVALAGPLVNIFMAIFLFTLIWISGGRQKPFSEFTHLIGWVDKTSQIYSAGVRPGDQIDSVNNRPFVSFNDFMYAAFLDAQAPKITGLSIDYFKNQTQPFSLTIEGTQNLEAMNKARLTVAMLNPANYLIFDPMQGSNPIVGSPLKDVGLQKNDRIICVDGELIFSQKQLVEVINESKALLTIRRADKVFIARVPRVPVADLRMGADGQSEVDDWFFESKVEGKYADSFFIPYEVSANCQVMAPISYIDENLNESIYKNSSRSNYQTPLEKGDIIIAVDGIPVSDGVDLTKTLQSRQVQIIIQRGGDFPALNWKLSDAKFFDSIDFSILSKMISSIGTPQRITCEGNLCLLSPIELKPIYEYSLSETYRSDLAKFLAIQKKRIEAIKDPQQKEEALKQFEQTQKQLVLGIQLYDRSVIYNPTPITLLKNAFDETFRTIKALFTGYLSPKYMAGPVGIMQAIHKGWTMGVNEALFWVAIVSLNLGVLNLLPIPVLDGGHICISLWESFTKKRIKAKTMERLIIPFIVLMIVFFLYATYNDILRLISRIF